jgi:hypothetical protein
MPPGHGPHNKVGAWNSFVVDTRTSKVYSVAAGGHADYAGNEVDALTLENEKPFWTQLLAPTPTAQITDSAAYYADGRPTSRHTYYGVSLDTTNDRIMLFGGASWSLSGTGPANMVSSYNIAANSYNGSSTHPDQPHSQLDAGGSVNPFTGDFYSLASSTLYRWNRSSNSWTNLIPSGASVPNGTTAMSAMDTTRGRILFIGGGNSDRHYYSISGNSWTQVTLSGSGASAIATQDSSGGHGGAMIYVAEMDKYLVRLKAAGSTVYQIDPLTFEVTTFPTTNGGSIPASELGTGCYNKFLYVPRLGGAIYVPTYSGNTWFLRLH